MQSIPPLSSLSTSSLTGNVQPILGPRPMWVTILGALYVPVVLALTLYMVVTGVFFLAGALLVNSPESFAGFTSFICLINVVMIINTFPISFGKRYAKEFSLKEKKIMLTPIPVTALSFISVALLGLLW